MPRNLNSLDRARVAFQHAVGKAHLDNREPAVLGWRKAETEILFTPPGRANYVYITKSDQTVAIALNRAGVPKAAFLPVWVVLENNTLVITGRNNADAATLTNVPDSDYGVPAHPLSTHSDVTLTALADGEMLEWNATASVWVNAGIGANVGAAINAATADTPLAADKFGFWDVVDAALKSITWTNFLAAIHSAAHALTNKTIDSTNIASLTAKTPPVDADSVVIVDSAAANVFKSVTWANVKATLLTNFSTLFAVLAGTAGGQHLKGGTAANEDLTLEGTAHATKTTSYVLLQPSGGNVAVGKSSAERAFVVSAATNAILAIDGPAIDFSANQQTAFGAYADEAASISLANNSTGGIWYRSFNKAAADGIGGYFTSYSEVDLTTFSSFELVAKKHNGSGAMTAHGANARILSILNNATNLMNLMGDGRLGLGTTSPQGRLHIHDGTSGKLFVTKTGVVGSEVTIIPDGTGDVARGLVARVVARGSSGTVERSSTVGFDTPGAGSTSAAIVGGAVTLKLYSTGQLVVYRASGAETWTVTVDVVWQ